MNDVFNYLLNWDQDAFKCPPELESLDRVMLNTEEVQTVLFKQHPWHPYDPSMPWKHPCRQLNKQLAKCFNAQTAKDKDMPLKVQHVYCLEDRISLMVCLTKHKREKREAESAKRSKEQKPS
eukprot:TRINITY_DN16582_c0_g1_i1.p1 TRINITY_DN16582_c0_g1~~TRINITY_DN16582_c0_g1_i1.p1  ORF type:complete len:131 (+),score=10.48 TRINITY_DN16582_c0_g1_i1:28-393(+)